MHHTVSRPRRNNSEDVKRSVLCRAKIRQMAQSQSGAEKKIRCASSCRLSCSGSSRSCILFCPFADFCRALLHVVVHFSNTIVVIDLLGLRKIRGTGLVLTDETTSLASGTVSLGAVRVQLQRRCRVLNCSPVPLLFDEHLGS